MNDPASNALAAAGAAPKNAGCGPEKFRGIDMSSGRAALAVQRCPPDSRDSSMDASVTGGSLTLVSDGAASLAGAVLQRPVEVFEDGRQLLLDVAYVQVLRVQRILAMLAVPQKAVFLVGPALALDHQSDGVG